MKGSDMRWRERLPKIFTWLGVLGLVVGFLSGIGALSYFAETFPIWTGFNRIPEFDAQGNITKYVAAKTLWDWLNLLLIPLVLTGGGIWFTRSENRQAREIEKSRVEENRRIEHDRTQNAVVKDYLDQMTELLLTRGLRTSLSRDEVRSVARAQTLTVLRSVDSGRKAMIVQFLSESELVGHKSDYKYFDGVISLRGGDLAEVILAGIDLTRVDLRTSYLRGANLIGTSLVNAKLTGANLMEANLSAADLTLAKLTGANLVGVDLTYANLVGADLRGINFSGADLRRANLAGSDLEGSSLALTKLGEANFNGVNLAYCREVTLTQLLEVESLYGAELPDYINPVDLGDKWSPPKDGDLKINPNIFFRL